jgi:DNA-binding HxlR family transcriptional regulator/putative sterol carrier protein
MRAKRSYDDLCAVAHALDLVGERWALLIVRELLLGPKRFTDLRRSLVSISPNVLTQRLTELETARVLTKFRLPPPAAAWVYELTPWGRQLEPVIQALALWGVRSPRRPHEGRLSLDSLMLSFRVTFDAQKAGDFRARLELRLCDEVFHVEVADGELELGRGATSKPDVVLELAPPILAALAYGGRDFEEAVTSGDVRVEGDAAIARRWLTLFRVPTSVGAA